METKYVEKLRTPNYSIGSFDAYEDKSKELLMEHYNYDSEKANEILKTMPTLYRATILDNDGNYIGFIGLYNINAQQKYASIRMELNTDIDPTEIINEFRKFCSEALNIQEIIETTPKLLSVQTVKAVPSINVVIPEGSSLVEGIDPETLDKFKSQYSDIGILKLGCSIKKADRIIGIIGLTSLIWSNQRANLNIYFDKSLNDEILEDLSEKAIDDYLVYIHQSNVHNVTMTVPGSDKNKLEILRNTNMNFYGVRPYGVFTPYDSNDQSKGQVESGIMFQHIPHMTRQNGIYIPDNVAQDYSVVKTDKEELSSVIDLGNGYKLVRPSSFLELGIDPNKMIDGYIEALQDRERFSKPVGDDKYFIQKGKGNYGASKATMTYDYILVDENNNYAGYVNRINPGERISDIELGIKPEYQNKGLGRIVTEKFCDELFSIGYPSVTTSGIFEFNNHSLKLIQKVAKLSGVRLQAYYMDGKLHDMSYYTKVNKKLMNK